MQRPKQPQTSHMAFFAGQVRRLRFLFRLQRLRLYSPAALNRAMAPPALGNCAAIWSQGGGVLWRTQQLSSADPSEHAAGGPPDLHPSRTPRRALVHGNWADSKTRSLRSVAADPQDNWGKHRGPQSCEKLIVVKSFLCCETIRTGAA